ncbi:DNA-binding response regulator [Streptomyces sp. NPDC060020]|uniref:DNA-binding response regulator n=1 Tax=unclassified Streptomyces TaxID=2593676 RepID=UPI0036A518B8
MGEKMLLRETQTHDRVTSTDRIHKRTRRIDRVFQIIVHSGFKEHFDRPESAPSVFSALRSGVSRIDFADDAELIAATTGPIDVPILVPVISEFQAETIRTIRMRHPLSLITAVTDDVTGHLTYGAIRSGAKFVLNLAIPAERQLDLLFAQFHTHFQPRTCLTPTAPGSPQVAGTPRDHGPARLPAPSTRQGRPVQDAELMRLLCTPMTVAEIARRHYCSERSMYRRIRQLYNEVGVRGRTELMVMASMPA